MWSCENLKNETCGRVTWNNVICCCVKILHCDILFCGNWNNVKFVGVTIGRV